ncbi:MAG: hypothetical protein Q4G58_02970 [bacterium]|nr:hypothetical protein [bacterium]
MTSEYLEDKYQLTDIEFGKIGTFNEVYGGIDATVLTRIKGFIIEANEFKVYLAFDNAEDYSFSDDYQSRQIESDLQKKLDSAFSGTGHLSMDYKDYDTYNDNQKLYGYNDYENSYADFYNGNLTNFFVNSRHIHKANIYLEGEQEQKTISRIKEAMDETGVNYTIYGLKDKQYKQLEPHFDDYDYMAPYLRREDCITY